ncbi:MAG: bifunctional metallophosphatase/5'-nucleotidase [Cytophagales bacterium]|nr:bifunctional metallophosphatase/5'-nucleotidase [Cytophagales bacterium]
MPRISLFLTLFAVVFSCCGPSSQKVEFYILQMNDVYEIAPLEGGKVGGVARVATVLDSLKAINPNTISLLSGDFLSPSLIGTLKYQGQKIAGLQMVEALNVLGLDYVGFGNHEFDVKEHEVQQQIDRSAFTWISSNTFHRVNGQAETWTQRGTALPAFIAKEFKNDSGASVRIGLIGINVDFNKKDYVSYNSNYAEAGKAVLEKYKDAYDVPIAITHLEVYQDKAFSEALPQIPLLLGGHDHVNMSVPVGKAVITKADANAKTVYIHRCTYDQSTKELSIESTLKPITDKVKAKPAVQAIVDKWTKIAEESMLEMGYDPGKVVYSTSEMLDGREKSIRNEPTNLGDMIAQSIYVLQSGLDFAVYNSGSIRLDDQLIGDITQTDILRTLPFGGELVVATMRGSEVQKMLQIGFEKNKGIGGYFQSAKITVQPDGFLIDGKAIVSNKIYTFIAPAFLMSGKEANLDFLKDVSSNQPAEFGNVKNDFRDAVIAYMSNLSGQ